MSDVADVWDAVIVLADATEWHGLGGKVESEELSMMIEAEREISEMKELIKQRYQQLKAWVTTGVVVWPETCNCAEFRSRYLVKVKASLAMLEEFLPYCVKA